MVRARATAQRFRRKPAPLALRSLAALVALLLVGSSLGQMAHFLLVQHTVCVEHGELLEVHAQAHAPEQAEKGHDGAKQTRISAAGLEGEHDHCQLLARTEREPALAAGASVATVPPCAAVLPAPLAVHWVGAAAPLLSLAPKTSPPCPAALG